MEIDNIWLHLILNSATTDLIKVWRLFNDYIYFQIILLSLIFYTLAKVLQSAIPSLVDSISRYFKLTFGEILAKLLAFPVFYLSFFLGSIFTVYSLDISETTQDISLSVLQSLIIAVLSISVFQILAALLLYKAENAKANEVIQLPIYPLLKNALLIGLGIVAIHQIFGVWGVDMAAILAAAGIAGLAVAMAAKDVLSDVIAGILIMTDRPYTAGQTIELESGLRGVIQDVGLRSTRILTKDNIDIIVPNSIMGSSKITNESSAKTEGIRLKVLISTASGVDFDYIRTLLIDVLDQQDKVMHEMGKKVILVEFNETFTTFCLLFWVVDPGLRGSLPAGINEQVYKKFLAEKVPLAAITEREIAIKEIPNLFGHQQPREIK